MRRARSHLERITGYPNPFEAWTLLACGLQGALVLTGTARSATVADVLSSVPGLLTLWGLLLLCGGFVALVGLYWRGDVFLAVEIKRVGLVAVGFGILIYGVALLLSGRPGLIAGTLDVGLAIGAFTRVWQVNRMLAAARAKVQEARETTDGKL